MTIRGPCPFGTLAHVHTPGKSLILDADDTLWENNALFERVVDDFIDWLAHPTVAPSETRRILDETEAANTVAHGYGSRSFLRSLRECFARLNERPADATEEAQIDALAEALVEHRIELLPGVADTLDHLGERHDLYLLTKGDAEEQQRKVDASGLGHHFCEIRIVHEKNTETYLQLVAEHGFDPTATWMIGNSPRSDILPARRAGLNAVYIPDENPWVLEHDEVDREDNRVLHLTGFGDLTTYF